MRIVMIAIAIMALLGGLIIWSTSSSDSVSYPNEKFLKEAYTQSIQKNNAEAEKQFGALVKKDQKVELQSFQLQKCSHAESDKMITCLVNLEVKSPMYGVQKRNMEFYLKSQNETFQTIGQKQL